MMKVVDPGNLAPDGFEAELSKCWDLLSFEVGAENEIWVEEHNITSEGLAWNGAEYHGGELRMGITLFARDIDANVRYGRMNYWLLIALHELAHVYYRQQMPEAALLDLGNECDTIAHNTLRVYKEKYT